MGAAFYVLMNYELKPPSSFVCGSDLLFYDYMHNGREICPLSLMFGCSDTERQGQLFF